MQHGGIGEIMTQAFYVRQSDGLVYSFCPVPTIAESHEALRTSNNEYNGRLATINTITFNGVLLPDNPALSGVADDATCLELLDRKSDQLRAALNEDRGNLLIFDSNGYTVLNIRPVVRDISFDDSRMTTDRKYSVAFEWESDFGNNKVREFSDTWSFNAQEDDTIQVQHNVSAVGIPDLPAGTGALQNAKAFVLSRANSLDRSKPSFLTAPYVPTLVDLASYTEYNHIRSENVNHAAGSYDVNESWVMASGAFKDDRTIQTNYIVDIQGNSTQQLTINGTVLGYGNTTFERYNNAASGFNNFVAPQIGFNAIGPGQEATRTDNRFAGTVSYSIKAIPSGQEQVQNKQISRTLTRNEDGTVTQSVTTSSQVAPGVTGIAAARTWAHANNYPIDSVEPPFTASLSGNLETLSVQIDDINGTYSLTKAYREQGTPNYREEWQVQRQANAENAVITVSINGTVVGLSSESTTSSEQRFIHASGAFFGTNGIYSRVRDRCLEIMPTGTCISNNAKQETLGFNKKNGIITYSYAYDNRFLSSNPYILNEEVEVTFSRQGDVVVEIPIPGKTDGPILQDQETKTGLQKTLRISYRMRDNRDQSICQPMSSSLQSFLLETALAESDILVNNTMVQNTRGEKPIAAGVFKVQDEVSFGRQSLVFQRNVVWKYTAS
jgi:hypothetical protein